MPKASPPLGWLPEVAANMVRPWAGRASEEAGPKSAGGKDWQAGPGETPG